LRTERELSRGRTGDSIQTIDLLTTIEQLLIFRNVCILPAISISAENIMGRKNSKSMLLTYNIFWKLQIIARLSYFTLFVSICIGQNRTNLIYIYITYHRHH